MANNTMSNARARAMAMFVSFSGLLKKDVISSDGVYVGNIWDISFKLGEIYPKTDEIIIYHGNFKKGYVCLPWSSVVSIEDDVFIDVAKKDLIFAPGKKDYEFLLRRDILDQQIVDTYNHKVRRVNDIDLLRVDRDLVMAHVDIGLRSLFRRLGWEVFVDTIVRVFSKNSPYLKKRDLIPWKYVQPVAVNPSSMTMKLSLSQKHVSSIPAADLGDIIFDLNHNQRIALFRAMDLKTQAKILENIEFDEQHAILKDLNKKELSQIISYMSMDEATDLLEKLPHDMVNNLLPLVESSRAKKLSTLLGYSADSAGGLMTTELVALPDDSTVESALEYIRTQTKGYEVVPYIYLVDDKNHLMGITTIRRLLFADPKDLVMKTVFNKTLYVYLNNSAKEIAYYMDKYKISAIAVVDENKVLQGIITMDDILSQVISIAWRRKVRVPKGL